MKRFFTMIALLSLALPAFAKTHREMFNVPCSELWPAVKDTLRNSGKYGIIGIENTEMTASYNMGGGLTAKRTNSVVLNSAGNDCELQIQTAFSGLVNNDAGDFRKRVDNSLSKLRATNGTANPSSPKPDGQALPPLPEPTAPAPTAGAQIAVVSIPEGADIEIDGSFVGSTPSSIELVPGEHSVAVRKKGFKPWERKIKVSAGSINLRAELDTAGE